MARPKADTPGPNAKGRLSDAFWSMLSEMDYSQITVDRLSSRAGVNHNTFYYHFKKLDDYALEAAGGEAARCFAETVVPLFCGKPYTLDARAGVAPTAPLVMAHSIARNGSSALVAAMVEAAIRSWARGEGIDPYSLGDADLDALRAVFGGLSCILGTMGSGDIPERAESFSGSRLGGAFAETLVALGSSPRVSNQSR